MTTTDWPQTILLWWRVIFPESLVRGFWIPLAIGFGTPFFLILVNHSMRLNRLKRIHGFAENFAPKQGLDPSAVNAASGAVDSQGRPFQRRATDVPTAQTQPRTTPPYRDIRYSSSLEFVVTKYVTDLDEAMRRDDYLRLKRLMKWTDDGPTTDDPKADFEYLINRISCYRMRVNRRALRYATPFALLVALGWSAALWPAFVYGPYKTATASCQLDHSIITIAFVGAFGSVLTMLVRAVSLFDLTPTTFFRGLLHIFGSVTVAIVLWNVLLAMGGHDLCGSLTAGWFYPFIFAASFVPDAGLQFVLSSVAGAIEPKSGNPPEGNFAKSIGSMRDFVRGLMNFLKLSDGRFASATKSIPLDVIDGIDFFTRFRLSEAGIYEVENLAVANPIMLHVETPFGIYQTIDWVGQAQLCTVVGPERFLMLRQWNIRTVFDLERAVLSLKSTTQFRRILAELLMRPTFTMQQIDELSALAMAPQPTPAAGDAPVAAMNRSPITAFSLSSIAKAMEPTKFRFRLAQPEQQPLAGANGCAGYGAWMTAPASSTKVGSYELCENERRLYFDVYEAEDDDATIKHMVRVIMDDLHVMRLRQIWESISRILGPDAANLDDSEDVFLGA